MIQLTIGFDGAAQGEGTLFVREQCGAYRAATEDEVRDAAIRAVARKLRQGPIFSAPREIKEYLVLRLAQLQFEVFGIMMLDSQHRLIEDKVLFRGTLNQTSVYPREIVKEVLACNAACYVCYHNHPSGSQEPSRADEYLTQTLKAATALVDVRLLDHFIVGGAATVSFAERGLL